MQTLPAFTALAALVTSPDFVPWNDPDETTRPSLLDPTGFSWLITPAEQATEWINDLRVVDVDHYEFEAVADALERLTLMDELAAERQCTVA
ncbi:hypothetical protein [Streptomyces sp. ISBFB 2968]|uniref:hypothetical protein n=1 Tax=Streptomyces sp. ISBFB 2968 TaxID=2903527 RepID=UPI002FDC78B5